MLVNDPLILISFFFRMSGYNEYLAEESFRNLKRNMEKGREGLITWEENMLLIENELAIFKGNTFEVLQMRKHSHNAM